MSNTPDSPAPNRRLSRRGVLGLLAVGALGATGTAAAALAVRGSSSAPSAGGSTAEGFLTATTMHSIELALGVAAFSTMMQAFKADGSKAWITGDVVIDGTRHTGVGLRLKGNSSLKSVSATSPPESLPWLIRLDKYTPGANHQGMSEFIVRSNSTATALNEAVALDLLAASGLVAQRPALVRLRVNSSAEVLRLVVENPGRAWTERVFAADGLLYKAEADGDYSYRGAAAASYDGIFDQEVGAEEATPLIDFLDFVNNSDDATFAAQLGQHLDAEAFATYLGFEELIDNFDDIDGPGNNSYLWWARQPDRMTVVAWDHNLAFGARPGTGGTNQPGAGRPSGAPPMGAPRSGGAGGPGGKANALVSRFTTLADGTAKVAAAKERLRGALYTSGRATAALDAWTSLIQQRAADLVSADVLASERAVIQRYIGA